MTRRRRIARILDRLSSWVFSPYAEQWRSVTQESLDRMIDSAALSDLADTAAAHAHGLSDSGMRPPGLQRFEDQGVPFLA